MLHTLITKAMIKTDPNDLTNNFLTIHSFEDFQSIKQKKKDVSNLYTKKVEVSTCKHCHELCFEDCILCDYCKYWYHYEWENVSNYYINKSSSWSCKNCKINKKK